MQGFFDRNRVAQTKQLPDTSVRRLKIYKKTLWIKVVDIFFHSSTDFLFNLRCFNSCGDFQSQVGISIHFIYLLFFMSSSSIQVEIYMTEITQNSTLWQNSVSGCKNTAKKEDLKNQV